MPSSLVFSESIVGPIAAALPCFRATLRQGGRDAAWVRVTGELDIATAPQLEHTLREAQLRARRVVPDLRELTFMDCAGIRAILAASNHARQAGAHLVVVRGPSHVDRVFTLTGTSDAVKIVDLDPVAPPVQALVELRQHIECHQAVPRFARRPLVDGVLVNRVRTEHGFSLAVVHAAQRRCLPAPGRRSPFACDPRRRA